MMQTLKLKSIIIDECNCNNCNICNLKKTDNYYEYSGELNSNNRPHGFGTGIFNTFKYCGEWKDGLQCGKGIKIINSDKKNLSFKFDGYFDGCYCNGYGILYINNKLYYKGNFHKNKFNDDNGKLYHLENGNVKYEGKFKDNQYNGYGKLFNLNGETIYTGEFINNLKHGRGKLYENSFSKYIPKYEGDWFEDKFHGIGYYKYDDSKSFYKGDYKNNLKHGNGNLVIDNINYNGSFIDDNKDGEGIQIITYNKKTERYEGEFKKNNYDGYGTIKYINNDTYDGKFKDGKKNGLGTYRCSRTRVTYTCNWYNDYKDGEGIMNETDIKFKCLWKNDKIISKKRQNYTKESTIDITCPISLEKMEYPVIASDGHSYDKSSLEKLFKKNRIALSPITREKLDKNIMINNLTLKKIITNT